MSSLDRQRRKHLTKAQKLIPEAKVQDYVFAVTGPYPVTANLWLLVGAVGITVLLSAATGQFVAPGGLLILGVKYLLNEPRGIVLADHGVAVVKRGFVTGKPGSVLVRVAASVLEAPIVETHGKHTKIRIADQELWLKSGEHNRLRTAASASR
jgi:hypothetical protein